MPFVEDLIAQVRGIFSGDWQTREGQVVPDPETIQLGGKEAVRLPRATILYADLAGSTGMVDSRPWTFSAEIYKSYLHCAASVIRFDAGEIRAYDGDRIMGVFIGANQCFRAVKVAFKLNWVVHYIINPELRRKYPNTDMIIRQGVGIDVSEIHAARTGVRGRNDIVWVGRAANHAAKMAQLREIEYTIVSDAVFQSIGTNLKFVGGNAAGQFIWQRRTWTSQGGSIIHGSNGIWDPATA